MAETIDNKGKTQICMGVLAHVDAGKTTLCEAILYSCRTVRQQGRVDRGDTLLDHDAIERRRGITVFSDQADFTYGDQRFTLIDTPGHTDFAPEMERVLPALDAAIVVVSAADGIQAHTRTIRALLKKLSVPTVFFINKCDLAGADRSGVLRQLAEEFGATDAENLLEAAAETDDALLNAYLDGTADEKALLSAAARAFSACRLFPVYAGAALTNQGVDALLRGICDLLRTEYDADAPLRALCYKVRRGTNGERTEYLKILSGTLHPKDLLGGEKVHEIRRQEGRRAFPLDAAEAGCCCAVTGLTQARAGDCLTAEEKKTAPTPTPLLRCAVVTDEAAPTTLAEKLKILEDEEPTLRVSREKEQTVICVSGPIQMEILQEQMPERFGIPIRFEDVRVQYMETLAAPVYGCGHFEPLRHYAEVHLLLTPTEPGSGITFESRCPTDDLALNWQRLIETHVFEKQHVGVLTGSPLTDVRISLIAGKSHVKHTEGGDFREAVYRAIRQALFSGESVLLEPISRFTVLAESHLTGRLMTDLQSRFCEIEPPQTQGETVVLCGTGPASELLPYSREIASLTRGRGSMQFSFARYAPCHNAEQVIDCIGYEAERDTENPASSVFCDHGTGVTVDWRSAPAAMHIRRKEKPI